MRILYIMLNIDELIDIYKEQLGVQSLSKEEEENIKQKGIIYLMIQIIANYRKLYDDLQWEMKRVKYKLKIF